jgi:hypothetical protein
VSMDVRWHKRDWEPLREEVAEVRPAVRASLAASGLLKFFECPLIRAQEYLLQFMIEMWSPAQHCFLVRGEQIAFTVVEDIYFLTGLPFRGTPLRAVPVLPSDTDLAEVVERYCSDGYYMTGSSVRIRAIDVLLHRCVAAMIVRVYGTRAPHRISSSELTLMERVVVGREQFAWGLMLHTQMIAQLDRCQSTGRGGVFFWLHPGGLFLREGVSVAAEGGAGGTRGTRPTLEAVVRDFCSPQWWQRGTLRYGGGSTDMVVDTAVYTPVPLCGGGLPGGPGYDTASWGGF